MIVDSVLILTKDDFTREGHKKFDSEEGIGLYSFKLDHQKMFSSALIIFIDSPSQTFTVLKNRFMDYEAINYYKNKYNRNYKIKKILEEKERKDVIPF